jgi:hypothetical protein
MKAYWFNLCNYRVFGSNYRLFGISFSTNYLRQLLCFLSCIYDDLSHIFDLQISRSTAEGQQLSILFLVRP